MLLDRSGKPVPPSSGMWTGIKGHPVRVTIYEMGPLLLPRILDLNETQSGLLQIIFRATDDQGLLLLDIKDLRVMLQYAAENA